MKTTLEVTHTIEITVIKTPFEMIVLVEESIEIVERVELQLDAATSLILSQEALV
jgi:hypothetical protein